METIFTIIHVFVGLVLILVVLLQTGKGAAMGSAFGGSSQTVFGSSGAGNFLTKFTTACAVVFMLTSLTLSAMSSKRETNSIVTEEETTAPIEAPKAPLPDLPGQTQTERYDVSPATPNGDVAPGSPQAQTEEGAVPLSSEGVPAEKKTD